MKTGLSLKTTLKKFKVVTKKEADTRTVMHACSDASQVVIVAKVQMFLLF